MAHLLGNKLPDLLCSARSWTMAGSLCALYIASVQSKFLDLKSQSVFLFLERKKTEENYYIIVAVLFFDTFLRLFFKVSLFFPISERPM